MTRKPSQERSRRRWNPGRIAARAATAALVAALLSTAVALAAPNWLSPVQLAPSPRVALDAGHRACVVWEVTGVSPDYRLRASTRPEGGSWSASPEDVPTATATKTGSYSVLDHAVAATPSGVLQVVWRAQECCTP